MSVRTDTLPNRRRPILNFALWFIQVLLGLLFIFGGVMKLITPIEVMTQQMSLPGMFLRFIGVSETLGGLGLILPGLLRIKPGLTPLAASGLVIIMIGATSITVASMGVGMALIPLITGVLCLFVAYGRWQLVPHRDRASSRNINSVQSPVSTGS